MRSLPSGPRRPLWLPTKTWLVVVGATTLAAFTVGGVLATELNPESITTEKVVVQTRNVPGPAVPGPTVYVPESDACKQAAQMSTAYAKQVEDYSTTMAELGQLLSDSKRAVYEKNQLEINDSIETLNKLNQKTDGQVRDLVAAKALLDKKMEQC